MDGGTTQNLREQINAIGERGILNAERIERMEKCLQRNTELTEDMYAYLITARTGTKMIKGAAAIATAIAGIGAAVVWFRQHLHL